MLVLGLLTWLLAGASPLSAQGPPPQFPRVVYVVDFGDDTAAAVSELRLCCGDNTLVVAATTTSIGCPSGLNACEFVTLKRSNADYQIVNQYNPGHPDHGKELLMMEKPSRFASTNPARRKNEILKALYSAVTCHNVRHGGAPNPSNTEPFCQKCTPYVPPPQLALVRQ